MSAFTCPYCSVTMPVTNDTYSSRYPAFDALDGRNGVVAPGECRYLESCLAIQFFKCPNCGEYAIFAKGLGDKTEQLSVPIKPISSAKQFPDYIPKNIRDDYEEACAIVNLSPKASATLSRRCLQAMIRNFWNISKATLYKEIESLDAVIPATQKKVLHSLRQIGNIGAHPEADVNTIIDIEPGDAEKLIKVIEFFIDKWYIDHHEQECLFNEINALNDDMQDKKKADE
ncbi:MAG: DUF4145 domain-containing protein [Clostridia bacterium]